MSQNSDGEKTIKQSCRNKDDFVEDEYQNEEENQEGITYDIVYEEGTSEEKIRQLYNPKTKHDNYSCNINVETYDIFKSESEEENSSTSGFSQTDADDEYDASSDDVNNIEDEEEFNGDAKNLQVQGLYEEIQYSSEEELDDSGGEIPCRREPDVEDYRPLFKDLLKRPIRPFPKRVKPNPYRAPKRPKEVDPIEKLNTGGLKMPPDDFEFELPTDPNDPNYLGECPVDPYKPHFPICKEFDEKTIFDESSETVSESDTEFVTETSEYFSTDEYVDTEELDDYPEESPYPIVHPEEYLTPQVHELPDEYKEKIPPGNPQVRTWYDNDANEYFDVLNSKGEWVTMEQVKIVYPPVPRHPEVEDESQFAEYLKGLGLGEFMEAKNPDQSYDPKEYPTPGYEDEASVIREVNNKRNENTKNDESVDKSDNSNENRNTTQNGNMAESTNSNESGTNEIRNSSTVNRSPEINKENTLKEESSHKEENFENEAIESVQEMNPDTFENEPSLTPTIDNKNTTNSFQSKIFGKENRVICEDVKKNIHYVSMNSNVCSDLHSKDVVGKAKLISPVIKHSYNQKCESKRDTNETFFLTSVLERNLSRRVKEESYYPVTSSASNASFGLPNAEIYPTSVHKIRPVFSESAELRDFFNSMLPVSKTNLYKTTVQRNMLDGEMDF